MFPHFLFLCNQLKECSGSMQAKLYRRHNIDYSWKSFGLIPQFFLKNKSKFIVTVTLRMEVNRSRVLEGLKAFLLKHLHELCSAKLYICLNWPFWSGNTFLVDEYHDNSCELLALLYTVMTLKLKNWIQL